MAENNHIDIQGGHDWLENRGMNLRAIICVDDFDQELQEAWDQAGILTHPNDRLVLLGMAGSALWHFLKASNRVGDDRFDRFSTEASLEVSRLFWGDQSPRIIYPGDTLIPLQQLGRSLGWGAPSPLGLDIHPQYGPWFAYRAAFLTRSRLPATTASRINASPCDSCAEKPCILNCPVSALRSDALPNLNACVSRRIEDQTGCGLLCQSRLSCPVGREWRYSEAHLNYHGERSLRSLTRWINWDDKIL